MEPDVNVQEPITSSEEPKGPQTHAEAKAFHDGFISGLTTYARERGDSTLRLVNGLLHRLMDEQGWATIETFERLAAESANADTAIAYTGGDVPLPIEIEERQ